MKLKYLAKDEKNPNFVIFTCTGHYMSIKRFVYSMYEKNNIFVQQVVNVYLK